MSTKQSLLEAESTAALEQEHTVERPLKVIDPATIAAFAALGAQVLQFAGSLIGGKTGDALSEIADSINGIGYKIQNIGNQLEGLLTGVQQTIDSIDKSQLAKVWPVHSQVVAYRNAFPQGVPAVADTNNVNYVEANARSAEAMFYFQGLQRGALTFMPTLCHVTNTRMEVAVNTWQCWWQQNQPAQPNFAAELNLSAGCLNSNVSKAVSFVNKQVQVKPIKGSLALRGGPGGPIEPQGTIGYMVVDDGAIVFSKKGEEGNILKEANDFAAQRRVQKRQQMLGDYEKTRSNWVSMVGSLAPAGIQRALRLGDAHQFLSYVNPRMLVMATRPDPDAESNGESLYQPLPLRDILLDVLTSAAMKEKHGLLVKGADQRSVSFWFEKTFHREPTKHELSALMKVVDIFGYDSLFGCLAYSQEYAERYGTGGPGGILTAEEIPQPAAK
jgi:hypothetical protein